MRNTKDSFYFISAIIALFIFLNLSVETTAQNIVDSIRLSNQKILFSKYLKLSEDEAFQLDERKRFSEKAITVAKDELNPDALMQAMVSKGYITAQEGHYAKAFEIFNRIIHISDSVGYSDAQGWRRKAFLANAIGLIYKELGEYDKALNSYYKSLVICDSAAWQEGKSAALNNISALYTLVGNTKDALAIISESEKIAEAEHFDNLLFDIYINLMDIYVQSNSYDSASFYGQKALDLSIKLNTPYNQAFVEVGFGKLFSTEKKYSKAVESFNRAISITKSNGFDEIQLDALIELITVYRKQGKLAKASSLLLVAKKVDSIINIPLLHVKLLLEQSELLNEKGIYHKSLEFHKEAIRYKDSINSSWEKMKYSEIQSLYNIKLQKQRNMVLEKDLSIKQLQIKQQKLLIFISLGFLILLFGLVILFSRKRKFEHKTNLLLRKQNEKINSQEKTIRKKNEQNYKQELDYKNRQLTTFSLSAIKQSKSLDIIFDNINELLNQHSIKNTTRKKLEQIITHLRPLSSQKEWDEFRSYFEAVNPSFYSNLKNFAPNLTLNEQKICAYIKLGMSTKEIASITYRQVRSIESTRFRIRKKIGLTANENLYDFFDKL